MSGPACTRSIIITDPMYEEVISDLIKAGDIMTKCKHAEDGGVCGLCKSTWEGTKMNAKAITDGKTLLKGRKENVSG